MSQIKLLVGLPRVSLVNTDQLPMTRVVHEERAAHIGALEYHIVPAGALQKMAHLQTTGSRADHAIVLCGDPC